MEEKAAVTGDENNGKGEKKEVVITDYPVQTVVVYPDRAEVSRLVGLNLEAGDVEVVLKSLSKSLDKDSVRVDGIGPASITEVSYQEIAVTQEDEDKTAVTEEVEELKARVKSLTDKIRDSEKKKVRVTSQIDLLTKYSKGLLEAGQKANTSELLDVKTIGKTLKSLKKKRVTLLAINDDGVFDFMDTYEERSLKLKIENHDIELDIEKLEKDLEEARANLKKLAPNLKPSEPIKQQVIGVLLSVKESSEIKLKVTYVVSDASWTPKYDLRVSSAERSMVVNYFGMVQQNTGEDWMQTKLSLSTATPSIGGSAPKLETCKLTLVPNAFPNQGRGSMRKKNRSRFARESSSILEAPGAQVSEGLSSSVFEIQAIANIPADKSGHKVHVATINLKPTFEYVTVPKVAQHAFLKAKVTNSSNYAFLSGPANVFLDQSYVTESTLKSTAPMEDFSCSLGVDPSVRVVYKPIKRFREESGILSKNVTYSYKQITEISNTRSEPATVTFQDQLPKSQDEKLKVNLVEPVLVKQKAGSPPPNPHLNGQNNVEWCIELKPEETKAITIHYTVEFPANKAEDVEGL